MEGARMDRINVGGLQVAPVLHAFVNEEALPGTGITPDAFWGGLGGIVAEFAPERGRRLGVLVDHLVPG